MNRNLEAQILVSKIHDAHRSLNAHIKELVENHPNFQVQLPVTKCISVEKHYDQINLIIKKNDN